MPTYQIPESISDSHDGDEWAIAAIVGGRVVALRYIADIAPEVELTTGAIREWLCGNPLELRELQALGDVHAGIVTTEGFGARWRLAG